MTTFLISVSTLTYTAPLLLPVWEDKTMTSQLLPPHSPFVELCQQRGISDPRSGELARHLDECDPLKHLRDEFHIPKFRSLPGFESTATLAKFGENEESDSIYLCGNSLGLMPKRTEVIMRRQFEKWQQMQVSLGSVWVL